MRDAYALPPIGTKERKNIETRFWSSVSKTPSCWIWLGSKSSCEYGRFFLNGDMRYAHRVAYIMTYGDVPRGLLICHRCNNPSCVNPAHLYAGTQRQNLADRKRVGTDPAGERNGRAKLTAEDVRFIRRAYSNRLYNTRQLAEIFGVSQKNICYIVNWGTWKEAL